MMDVVYVLKDHFEMSEEVRNMSEEEMERQIAILEAEGRREKEKIEASQKEKDLLAI